MENNELLTIALVVVVPALLLWAIFIARTGRPGRPLRPVIGIPQALRPGEPDEVLEGPRLERIQVWGLVTSMSLAFFIPLYWLPETQRQESFVHRFDEESLERGETIFQPPPDIPETATAAEFKALEEGINLGMNCALCHGADAGGGLVQFTDPTTGEKVWYNAPPLNNVFTRWDEEIVRFTIERGRPGTPMPTWGVQFGGPMTSQMVSDVMAWLRSLPGNQEPPEELAKDASGAEIFAARCATCHGDKGQGKEAAGTLDDPWFQGMPLWKGDVTHLSEDLHLATITNGRRFAFMPPWGEAPPAGIPPAPYPLTARQIRAVMAYERSL